MSKRILSFFPPHESYVEPFGGGASILLAKKPCAGVTTYNDLDSVVCDFFRTIADPAKFEEFYDHVRLLPLSRELFYEYRDTWANFKGIERVARWFLVARQSFAGKQEDWGYSVLPSRKAIKSWLSAIALLPEVHQRLQSVQIEHNDFRKILKTYKGEGYLAYCDPPYIADMRKSGGYRHEMTDQDHRDLVVLLLKYDGAVVLSGYEHEIYKPLTDNNWVLDRFDVALSAARQSEGVKRTECIWRNPECMRRIKNETEPLLGSAE